MRVGMGLTKNESRVFHVRRKAPSPSKLQLQG